MKLKFNRNWGLLLLAVWLVLTGLIPLLAINITRSGTFMNILAVAAGVLLLLGR